MSASLKPSALLAGILGLGGRSRPRKIQRQRASFLSKIQKMAFVNQFRNILKQTISRHVKYDLLASSPSLYQAIRCMSSSKVFVGGLSYSTDDTSLREEFANYGSVIEARVIMDRETGRSRGFGFVSFTSGEEASAAIAALDGKDLHGRMIRVNYATDRTGGFRSGGGGYGNGGYGGGPYGGYNDGGYNNGGNYRGDGSTSADGYGGGSSGGSHGGSFEGGNGSYSGAPTAGGYGSGAPGAFSGGTFGGNGGSYGAPPSTGNYGDIYNGSSGNFAENGDGQESFGNQAFGNDGQDASQAGFRHVDDEPKNYANRQA